MSQHAAQTNTTSSPRVGRMLGLGLHGWENVMLGSLAFAAVFAAIVGISTYCVVQLQRQEIADSKQESDAYKLQTAKEIAEANARAEEARLQLARFRANRLLSESGLKRLAEKMSQFAGQRIAFVPFPVSNDTVVLMNQLRMSLGGIGMIATQGVDSIVGQIGVSKGVVAVHTTGSERGKSAASTLAEVLNEDGITARAKGDFMEESLKQNEARGNDMDRSNRTTVYVLIGEKP